MKKIENIIDNCIDCRFAERYNHPDVCRCAAFICTRINPQRLAGFDGASGIIEVPDWCPLETYKDAEKSEAQPETIPCYIGQSKVDEKARSTLILPGMPHLEWMSENLSGFGGTEVDGRWYYTWEEAMSAAEQLGNGWRLPTRRELVDLDKLGSIWQEEGPHGLPGRLFGGGLFLEASGFRNYASGALYGVGTDGDYWSSSPQSGSPGAGHLRFGSTGVYPLYSNPCALGFTVRCVRDVK